MADSTFAVSPAAPLERASSLRAFLDAVRLACDDGSFESLILSKPRTRGAGPKAIRVRRIVLKGRPALSFVAAHATRDITKNLSFDDGIAAVAEHLDASSPASFAHATLRAHGADSRLLVSRKGHATLRRHVRAVEGKSPATAATGRPVHDRERGRRLPLDLPWLVEFGLTDASHRLVPAMARKWRQIDKFLEVLDHALDALPPAGEGAAPPPLRVVDYGCGKGYLTFAVHEHLHRALRRRATGHWRRAARRAGRVLQRRRRALRLPPASASSRATCRASRRRRWTS